MHSDEQQTAIRQTAPSACLAARSEQRHRLVEHWRGELQEGLTAELRRKMELYAACLERLKRVHDASNLEVLPPPLPVCCCCFAAAAATAATGAAAATVMLCACSVHCPPPWAAALPTAACLPGPPRLFQVLRNAKVIGATTSGVAMHQGLIAALGVKVGTGSDGVRWRKLARRCMRWDEATPPLEHTPMRRTLRWLPHPPRTCHPPARSTPPLIACATLGRRCVAHLPARPLAHLPARLPADCGVRGGSRGAGAPHPHQPEPAHGAAHPDRGPRAAAPQSAGASAPAQPGRAHHVIAELAADGRGRTWRYPAPPSSCGWVWR